jgi:hypothetical protein
MVLGDRNRRGAGVLHEKRLLVPSVRVPGGLRCAQGVVLPELHRVRGSEIRADGLRQPVEPRGDPAGVSAGDSVARVGAHARAPWLRVPPGRWLLAAGSDAAEAPCWRCGNPWFWGPFYTQTHLFHKTGSGQTQGKRCKSRRCCIAGVPIARATHGHITVIAGCREREHGEGRRSF